MRSDAERWFHRMSPEQSWVIKLFLRNIRTTIPYYTIAAQDLGGARQSISVAWRLLAVGLRSGADEQIGFWHVGPRDDFEQDRENCW